MNQRLTIYLEPEGHYVSLETFAAAVQDLKQLVRGLKPPVVDPEKPVKWLVTHLEIGSAMVAAEPIADQEAARMLVDLAMDGIHAMENEQSPPAYFGREAIAAVKSLVETTTRDKTKLHVLHGNQQITVTERTASTAKKILDVIVWEDYGSVEGALEVVNLHGGYQCNVYDTLTNRKIQCSFRREDLDKVREALGRRVLVIGLVRYNRHGDILAIKAEDITILPQATDLPTVDEILGIAPDLTGGVPADVYIRRLRDE